MLTEDSPHFLSNVKNGPLLYVSGYVGTEGIIQRVHNEPGLSREVKGSTIGAIDSITEFSIKILTSGGVLTENGDWITSRELVSHIYTWPREELQMIDRSQVDFLSPKTLRVMNAGTIDPRLSLRSKALIVRQGACKHMGVYLRNKEADVFCYRASDGRGGYVVDNIYSVEKAVIAWSKKQPISPQVRGIIASGTVVHQAFLDIALTFGRGLIDA